MGNMWCHLGLIQHCFPAGAILLTKAPEPNPKDESPPFVATIELQPEGNVPPITYAAFTYIDIAQGERWIFPSSRAFPGISGATPKGLEYYRQQELKALRVSSRNVDSGLDPQI